MLCALDEARRVGEDLESKEDALVQVCDLLQFHVHVLLIRSAHLLMPLCHRGDAGNLLHYFSFNNDQIPPVRPEPLHAPLQRILDGAG